MDHILLDLSEHLLTDRTVAMLQKQFHVISIPIPHLRWEDDPETLDNLVIQICRPLHHTAAPVTVILPRHPVIALTAMAGLRGFLGYFPSILILKRDANGLYQPEIVLTIPTDKFKETARRDRAHAQSAPRASDDFI